MCDVYSRVISGYSLDVEVIGDRVIAALLHTVRRKGYPSEYEAENNL